MPMQELLGRLETRPVDSLALTGDSYRSEGVCLVVKVVNELGLGCDVTVTVQHARPSMKQLSTSRQLDTLVPCIILSTDIMK